MSGHTSVERGGKRSVDRSLEADHVLVELLVNAEARDRFLGSRADYLASFGLSGEVH